MMVKLKDPENERWIRFTYFEELIDATSLYSITEDGTPYSYHSGERKELSKTVNRGGYERVTLYIDGKRYKARIHVLVKETWDTLRPPGRTEKNYPIWEADHVDGDKRNNHVSNLEWVTREEQQRRAIELGLIREDGENNNNAKVTEECVRQIRWLVEAGVPQTVCEDIYGLKPKGVHPIVSGRTWQNVTERASSEEVDLACQLVTRYYLAQRPEPDARAPFQTKEEAVDYLVSVFGCRDSSKGRAYSRNLRTWAHKYSPDDTGWALDSFAQLPSCDAWRVVPVTDPDYRFLGPNPEPPYVQQYEVWEVVDGYQHAGLLTKWAPLYWALEATGDCALTVRLLDMESGDEIIFDEIGAMMAPRLEGQTGITRFSSLNTLLNYLDTEENPPWQNDSEE